MPFSYFYCAYCSIQGSSAAVLSREEMDAMNQVQLYAAVLMDAHTYKEAAAKMTDDFNNLDQTWSDRRKAHVDDVHGAQKEMQNLDVNIDVEAIKIGERKHRYVRDSAMAAKKQISRLQSFYKFTDNDTLVIAVYQLYSLGTAKKLAVEQIRTTLDVLPGIAIVLYPRIPKCARQTKKKGAAVAVSAGAAGVVPEIDEEDVDEEFNDCNADGDLPEVLSLENMAVTNAELTSQLTWDHFEIEEALLSKRSDDKEAMFPKRVSFCLQQGETIQALVIVPKNEASDDLLKATLLSTGIYLEVPLGEPPFRCSKKASQSARRAMLETGVWNAGEKAEKANRRAIRTQVPDAFHSQWLLDIIMHTTKKNVIIHDPFMGSGSLAAAAVKGKISKEAIEQGVRVCYIGKDFRRGLHDIAKATAFTIVAQQYLSGSLKIEHRTPVPDPGEKPNKARKMVQSLLSQPMKILSINAQGELVVPVDKQLAEHYRCSLTEEMCAKFEELRAEFPHKPDAADDEATPKKHKAEAGHPENSADDVDILPAVQEGEAPGGPGWIRAADSAALAKLQTTSRGWEANHTLCV